jgi:hypothetical protein
MQLNANEQLVEKESIEENYHQYLRDEKCSKFRYAYGIPIRNTIERSLI